MHISTTIATVAQDAPEHLKLLQALLVVPPHRHLAILPAKIQVLAHVNVQPDIQIKMALVVNVLQTHLFAMECFVNKDL